MKLRVSVYNTAYFYSEQDIVGREGVPGSPRAVHNGVNISCIKDTSMLNKWSTIRCLGAEIRVFGQK